MEFFKGEYVLIEYEKEGACTLVRWETSPSSEQYREGNEKILEVLEKDVSSTLLLDFKALNIMMSLSDQVWTAKDWLPKVLDKDVKKLALVTPSSFVTQIAIKAIYGALPQEEVNMGFFDEFDEAKSWVSEGSVPTSPSDTSNSW